LKPVIKAAPATDTQHPRSQRSLPDR